MEVEVHGYIQPYKRMGGG